MLRNILAAMARYFPPKFVADRVLPWFLFGVGVFTACWGLWEYGNDLSIKRVHTVLEMHKNFRTIYPENEAYLRGKSRGSPNNETRQHIFRVRCDFYLEKIRENKLKIISDVPKGALKSCNDMAVMDRYGDLLSSNQRKELREQLKAKLNAQIGVDSRKIRGLSLFFRSLIVCVESRNCDGQTAVALFSYEMASFVNGACLFDSKLTSAQSAELENIAKFLVRFKVHKAIYWNNDAKREKLFICEKFRKLE